MVSVLLWMAWMIVQFIIVRLLVVDWLSYAKKDISHSSLNPEKPPILTTLCVLILFTLGNAAMRVWVDQRPFYPGGAVGFLGTGYTEAQLLCGFAWVMAAFYIASWGFIFAASRDQDVRWTLTGLCGIVLLLGTSFVLYMVFQIPLGL